MAQIAMRFWKLLTTLAVTLSLNASLSRAVVQPSFASVEGFVLDTVAGNPVQDATVWILVPPLERLEHPEKKTLTTLTDTNGHFILENVEPGRKEIRAAKNAYGIPGGGPLTLVPGQKLTGVLFHFTPTGVLTGKVYDVTGQPVAGANIFLYTRIGSNNGDITQAVPNPSKSDDRGEFRIFDLPPDRYIVKLTPPFGGGAPVGSVLYPGVREVSKAITVEVMPGEEVRLDTIVMPAPLGLVRAHFVNMTGDPIRSNLNSIRFHAVGWGREFSRYALGQGAEYRPDTLGTFEILASGTSSEGNLLTGSATVNFTGSDVDVEVKMNTNPKVRLTGRVLLELLDGTPPQPLAGVTLTLRSSFLDVTSTSGSDGVFSTRDIFGGRYIPYSIHGLPVDAYVGSARYGESDLMTDGLMVQESNITLEVLVKSQSGGLRGRVIDGKGRIVPHANVVLVPETPLRDRLDKFADDALTTSTSYRADTTDQNGTFDLHGIIPGPYRAYAWLYGEARAYRNEGFLKRFEERGTPIQVEVSGSLSIDLRVLDEREERNEKPGR